MLEFLAFLIASTALFFVGRRAYRNLARAFADGRTPALPHFLHLLVVQDARHLKHRAKNALLERRFRKGVREL